jgi:hypothetical protein
MLLSGMSFKRDDPAWKYLEAIASDQGALLQLTPEAIDLFEASVMDRAGIDYGCVVAGVPKPRGEVRVGALLHPERVALRALTTWTWSVTSRWRRRTLATGCRRARGSRLRRSRRSGTPLHWRLRPGAAAHGNMPRRDHARVGACDSARRGAAFCEIARRV